MNSKGQTKEKKELSNPSLELATKAKGLQGCKPRLSPGVTFSCPLGVQKNVKETTFTFPSELPCWELESRWTPECLESNCKGQNPMVRGVLYTIRKILKRRCLKWFRITHLDIWSTSYGQKKGHESNWQFDSRPLKVRNRFDFLVCRWHATYHWKNSRQGLQLFFKPHLNRRFEHKVMGPQSRENLNFGNFKTPTWESRDKKSFGCGPRGEAQSIL